MPALPQLYHCPEQGKSTPPCLCLFVIFVTDHEQWFPDLVFASLTVKLLLVRKKTCFWNPVDVLISGSDFEVHSAVMTVLSCRSCQLRRAMHISRERRKSPPLLLSWAGLLGHREADRSGQCYRETVLPRSSSCVLCYRAGEIICSRKGG